MVDLSVKIGKLKLKNPVMAASGTFGPEYAELIDIDKLGAIVTKTITLESRLGNPAPRVAEAASGMINSIGLENAGCEDFIKNKLPAFTKVKTAIIASIAGDDEDEYAALAKRLEKITRVDAIEINLSCPNVKHGKREYLIAQDAEVTRDIVQSVRRNTEKTIIAKLSPNVTDIAHIAEASEKAGADAVLISNTFFGMLVDIETKKPRLGNAFGGLSGPAIKPIALYMVWKAHKKLRIPVIGCGGIMDHKDAVEFFLCGASAVQLGTANFVNPSAAADTIIGIRRYLTEHRIKSVTDLVGAAEVRHGS